MSKFSCGYQSNYWAYSILALQVRTEHQKIWDIFFLGTTSHIPQMEIHFQALTSFPNQLFSSPLSLFFLAKRTNITAAVSSKEDAASVTATIALVDSDETLHLSCATWQSHVTWFKSATEASLWAMFHKAYLACFHPFNILITITVWNLCRLYFGLQRELSLVRVKNFHWRRNNFSLEK